MGVSTFPSPDSRPDRFRVLFFTCAGGHEGLNFLPAATRTGPTGWPSGRRGIGATPLAHIDLREEVAPIEQHGFTMADFLPDRIDLRFFKWDLKTDGSDAIDSLEPFHVVRLSQPR